MVFLLHMSERVTMKVSPEKALEIQEYYSLYAVPNDGEYVSFAANYQGVQVTVFSSKKTYRSVTFVGNGALEEAKKFLESIGMPKQQQADVCCLALLTLANSREYDSWEKCSNEVTVQPYINFSKEIAFK